MINKIVNWIFCCALVLMALSNVSGQQWPLQSHYMLNKYRDNPAYGGLERSLSVFLNYRDQYNSFTGNPKTFYIGADMPFYIWNGALGFSLYNQSAGVASNTSIKGSYNYVLGTPYGFLSVGGRLGIDMLKYNSKGIITPDGDYDDGLNHNDPTLENAGFGGTGLSWELGAYFYGANIEAGITITDLPEHSFDLGQSIYRKGMSTTIFAQYKYNYSDQLKFLPSLLIRADKAVVQSDLSLTGRYNNTFLGGIGLRGYHGNSIDAIYLVIGTNISEKYFLTYSYDFGISQLRSYHQGTHEITLSYNLQRLIGLGLPPKIIYNPRDL